MASDLWQQITGQTPEQLLAAIAVKRDELAKQLVAIKAELAAHDKATALILGKEVQSDKRENRSSNMKANSNIRANSRADKIIAHLRDVGRPMNNKEIYAFLNPENPVDSVNFMTIYNALKSHPDKVYRPSVGVWALTEWTKHELE